MNFTDNNVTFKDIEFTGLFTGGPKISKGKYIIDNNGNIIKNMPIINAIDIDWCKANIEGITGDITTTGQLLNIIGKIKKIILGNNISLDERDKSILENILSIENIIGSIDKPGTILNNINSITGEIGNIHSGINSITGEIGDIHSGINSITGEIGSINSNINTITGEIGDIHSGINSITGEIGDIHSGINSITGEIDNIHSGINSITGEIGSINSNINTINEIIGIGSTGENESLTDKILQLQEQITAVNNRVDEYHLEYSFTYALNHIIKNNNNPLTMKKNDIVTLKFAPTTGYLLPASVNVEGATFSYDTSTGDITISNPIASEIVITMSTDTKRQCTFNIPTLTNLTCTIINNQKTYYNIGEQFGIRIDLSNAADTELWGLPTSISGTNCTITNYNSSTGEATITCSGTGNMSISATAKDVAVYRFAVALETNSIFTVSGGTITDMTVANIGTLEGAMSAIGQCPVNFDNGFNAPNSVDVEGKRVWFIIPSKYFNTSNFNFINGNNRYLLKQSNIQDLTVNTKIKDCVSITSGNIPYTLVCVSNNGLIGTVEFKKI